MGTESGDAVRGGPGGDCSPPPGWFSRQPRGRRKVLVAVEIGVETRDDADILAGIIEGKKARDRLVKSCARKTEGRVNVLDDILNRYEQKRSGPGGARGTAWAALNAVTEHADHWVGVRKVGTQAERDGRRMESILTGERDEMKQTALAAALAPAN